MKLNNITDFESFCQSIQEKLNGILIWKWDDRFGMPLAEFKIHVSEQVKSIVAEGFILSWNKNNISSAPKPIQNAAKKIGGIFEKQMLFCTACESEYILAAAWWPWGNGENISLRILAACPDNEQLSSQIKTFFKL